MFPWSLGHSSFFQPSFRWFWSGYWIIPTLLWSTLWKGLALWHAARRSEKWWFVALLIINTVGILEIIYLLFVARAFDPQQPPKEEPKLPRTFALRRRKK
jgi:methionyl-tRNA synthetase